MFQEIQGIIGWIIVAAVMVIFLLLAISPIIIGDKGLKVKTEK